LVGICPHGTGITDISYDTEGGVPPLLPDLSGWDQLCMDILVIAT